MNLSHKSASRTLPFLMAIALLGCKSDDQAESAPPPEPEAKSAQISNEYTATAEVTAIEREQRVVTLRREDGSLFALQVGSTARNFDQLEVGDTLRVRYKEQLAASLRPAGESAREVEGVVGAGLTEAGDKPGGGLAVGMSARVKLESIDLERDIVVFRSPRASSSPTASRPPRGADSSRA